MSAFTTAYRDIEAIHLEYHGGGSHKFYRVYVHDRVEIRQWGRVGTVGRFQVTKHVKPADAQRSGYDQWREKESSGYEVASQLRQQLSFQSAKTYAEDGWLRELSAEFDRALGSKSATPAKPKKQPVKKLVPMLCERGDPARIEALTKTGLYTWDVKWDGVRCLAKIDEGGKVTLTSRSNRDITGRFPEVIAELGGMPPGPWIFDGELVAFDATGATSFTGVNRRMTLTPARSQQSAKLQPATLVVFDLLSIPGGDLRGQTTFDRLTLLDTVLATCFEGSQRVTRSPRTDDGVALFEQTRQMGLEGVVAKDIGSPYIGGNRGNWIKFRHEVSVSCVITEVLEGDGNNVGCLGALRLGMVEHPSGRIVEVGKVGTGFSVAERSSFFLMRKELVGRVVEVQCAPPKSGEGLRFPVFKGLRAELMPDDCPTTQLSHPTTEEVTAP